MTVDEARSAALLLWPEDPSGLADENRAELTRAFRARQTPPLPTRFVEALGARMGRPGWEHDVVQPLNRARRAALGTAAAGEPRILVRVDEFPHARAFDLATPLDTDRFRHFHAMLAEADIPYLLAISPRVSRDYLNPNVAESRPLDQAEADQIRELDRDGVTFALHGLDHRTRRASARRRSELCGLDTEATERRIDRARAIFKEMGLDTPVFVPPFNRFDASQYPLLAERFDVICGGPESVRLLGFSRTPVWRGDAVYMPSYPPLYGTAAQAATGIEQLVAEKVALWAPLTLHWGWEADDGFAGMRQLCRILTGRAAAWPEFLKAVAASRFAA